MKKDKDIRLYNDKGQLHGYWKYYHFNGNLMFKGNYSNDKPVGYWEWYNYNGELQKKKYYI